MENNEDKIMGASGKKPPYEEDDVTTRKVTERIPVWINTAETQVIPFEIEVIDTITEDIVINVVECDWSHFKPEWEQDVESFLRENYDNIQEITFWL